ncbi:CoA transferase subunit A [Rhodococcus pyridinivorans]|uniref:3-oxoadipate:succinyl-CoA transferase subunit A n=4 Tax=Rhodococcus TaxID=1827 RepID=V9XD16_9NOCA|nr:MULTISPECIES: CoA-transferase [Rhodococcus]AHD21316.1 3-oxoadipate:succinyl-CoA transferase subunit A [Rhodococcus pyridinivorans SB3094]APE10683.1 3-oxoadipate--succinyl-CoA transferase subunit A [Rhodococcus sp. 2G]EHK81479.1 3-oxoadipate CoA-transferase alpha subunit [Rhodococcus pyridinivorans AK37]MCD2143353.1 CoA transferase subunit A [Rhodococcus pyridinivorans]MCT7291204.1 CoA transferase subunit A [Rhodococcus sp. PAE-6]
MPDKLMTLREAIATYVEDGMTVALEGFSHLIPFAAAHEIIRQGRRDLTLCRMTPDIISDQLIAADCVSKLVASFFASGSAGSLYEIRRRIESHDPVALEVEEYSHYGMVCRYQAGAAGLPFFPLRSYAGSDLPKINPNIRLVEDPFSGGSVYVVPPLNPDVTIIHAQRADRSGNVQIWGIAGVQQEAVYAAKKAIVVVEEIVDDDVIRSDPSRTLVPSHAVDAVVLSPRGAHPSYAQGYYDRDCAFYRRWTAISKDPQQLRTWLKEWVLTTADHAEYLEKLGEEYWADLEVAPRPSGTVDYGSRK